MDIGAAARTAAGTKIDVDRQPGPGEHEPDELALRGDLATAGASAHRNVRSQDDTSESQLIAR